MYFHGNAEDISSSYDLILRMSLTFKCDVLSVEYPGYGLYVQESSNAETIQLNSKLIMKYLIVQLNYDESDIVIVGRSIGSGPACNLAS